MKTIRAGQSKAVPTVFLVFAFAPVLVGAPGDENWDRNFGVPGVDGRIYAMAVSGNDLYVGGDFSRINGVSTTNIARWDGTNWCALGPGLGEQNIRGVRVLLVADHEVYAVGVFTKSGDRAIAPVARWNGREWRGLSDNVAGAVFALAWDGANLYAGGVFRSIGGINASNVARWDGTNWSPLGLGVHEWRTGIAGGPFDASKVYTLAVWDGDLYAGGEFEIAGIVNTTNIARWNGTTWSAVGTGLPLVATLLADDACLVAGGYRLSKWNGMSWSDLGGGISRSGSVYALAKSGNDLYVGGFFSSVGGSAIRNIAKWDGVRWSSLGSGLGDGEPSVMASNGSELFVAGVLNSSGGKPATNIARWRIPHALKINRASNDALLSWPATGSNLALESTALLGGNGWSNVANPVAIHEGECLVTNEISGPSRVYRLWGR